MLSYNLSEAKGPLYKSLYQFIREDIQSGKLKANEKLPSKRSLAQNLGISTISIENAYDQLICEGYIYSLPKRGYFVAEIENINELKPKSVPKSEAKINIHERGIDSDFFDFSSNRVEKENFPFSIWAKILREIISQNESQLLEVSPCGGVRELREAIANHLESFRGMSVNPDQIIVGAGTEYLYGLLTKLLGNDKTYCIENPGYKKLKKIYESNGAKCLAVDMDEQGLSIEKLRSANGQIAHISPTHHFPTGICMPASRRYEMLAWANESEENYIIEDDYDSEFRLKGKPLPPLFSLDIFGKVIYMNTFSKSLASTIRISYMILPEKLANLFYQKLAFYSCTVSTFEQYTLASFISKGFFEKHINRMRLHYGRKRARIIEAIKRYFSENECQIIENDSGLHFILKFNTPLTDEQFKEILSSKGILISSISDFEMNDKPQSSHEFILNYSSIDMEKLNSSLKKLREALI
ncbi:PLP-dependent aminotransferase family protein [Treponema ruminis]|uniref:GntR family transcriptional regulator/MocR family aminotransferase n=1 Tax=Treponema ruminis TaxID=744515 RepID=A0A7W8LL61_9SPIR|nr:PLP-dependent aminotransferase family protein [Treponema ruminis]MBB5225094.1 GntR family transcriptional regulator/MocR family aminotransferase [Treponema ruminis]QSI01015.1 PLP-dependent aminotransferase family protein [Treponema ruminis]